MNGGLTTREASDIALIEPEDYCRTTHRGVMPILGVADGAMLVAQMSDEGSWDAERILRWGIPLEKLEEGHDRLTFLRDSDRFAPIIVLDRLLMELPKFVVVASCEDLHSGKTVCGRSNRPEWVWVLILRALGYHLLDVVEDWPERILYFVQIGSQVVVPPAVTDVFLWLLHQALNLIEEPWEMDPAELSILLDEISDGTRE